MMTIFGVVFIIFCIVVGSEFLWRKKVVSNEQSRKIVHISVGVFASTWGFFLPNWQIVALAVAMFMVVFLSRTFGIFNSIHKVSRKTWGELFFPLGIAITALVAGSPWIFMAAMLHVGVADGLAALMGVKYIKQHGYTIFGQQKTFVGTLVFLLASIVIVTGTVAASPELQGNLAIVLLVPLFSMIAENLAAYGSDDLVVPLVVAVAMNMLVI